MQGTLGHLFSESYTLPHRRGHNSTLTRSERLCGDSISYSGVYELHIIQHADRAIQNAMIDGIVPPRWPPSLGGAPCWKGVANGVPCGSRQMEGDRGVKLSYPRFSVRHRNIKGRTERKPGRM